MDRRTRKQLENIQVTRRDTEIPAFIGDLHTGVVKDGDARVFVTVHQTGQVLSVKNQKAPNRLRWPVWVGYLPNSKILQVLRSRDYFLDTSIPDLPEHDHTWGVSDNPSWIRKEQFMEGLPVPIGGMQVRIVGYRYFLNGVFYIIANTIFDLASYVPASEANWVNVEVGEDRNISYTVGASYASRALLNDPATIPAVAYNKKLLFACKVYLGQEDIIHTAIDSDVFDPRFTGMGTGGGVASAVDWEDILNKPIVGYSLEPVTTVTKKELFTSFIDGALAVLTDVTASYVVQRYMELHSVLITCKNKGTANSTIIDMNINGVTAFTTQANRPSLAFNAALDYAISGTPNIVDLVPGDIITFDIDAIATGSANLTIRRYEEIVDLVFSGDEIISTLVPIS